MKQPEFGIFYGTSDKNGIWLETVQGLSSARERMGVIAATIPGQYFVFSAASHAILARIETFCKPESQRKSRGSAA